MKYSNTGGWIEDFWTCEDCQEEKRIEWGKEQAKGDHIAMEAESKLYGYE